MSEEEEEGDIFSGALQSLLSIGIDIKPTPNFKTPEEQEAPEPKPETSPVKKQCCSCTQNPYYQEPPEAPLELHDEVEARCGKKSTWSKAMVTKVHKVDQDNSKWLYNVRFEGRKNVSQGVNLRRCLIREPRGGEFNLKLFCTACGLPPRCTEGFESFKGGKGNMTFWAKPESLYGCTDWMTFYLCLCFIIFE